MSNPPHPRGTNPPPSATNPPPPGTDPPTATPTGTGAQKRVPVGNAPRPQADLATRLDGQRGWLNEIDRSLKKRSIIALVLTCLAVGVGAAAIYISTTKNSDADRISALETRIEVLEAAGATSGIAPSTIVPEPGVTDPSTIVPETGVTGTTDGSGGVTPLPTTPAE